MTEPDLTPPSELNTSNVKLRNSDLNLATDPSEKDVVEKTKTRCERKDHTKEPVEARTDRNSEQIILRPPPKNVMCCIGLNPC